MRKPIIVLLALMGINTLALEINQVRFNKRCLTGTDVSEKLESAVLILDKRITVMIQETISFVEKNPRYNGHGVNFYLEKLFSISELLESNKGLKIFCISNSWYIPSHAGAFYKSAYFGFQGIFIDKELIINNKAFDIAALILHETSHLFGTKDILNFFKFTCYVYRNDYNIENWYLNADHYEYFFHYGFYLN